MTNKASLKITKQSKLVDCNKVTAQKIVDFTLPCTIFQSSNNIYFCLRFKITINNKSTSIILAVLNASKTASQTMKRIFLFAKKREA